ncbi:MAG: ABC transporter ATP-binding protein [Gammaproteobacteria bacterium]|jgi:lipopolysaccharide transport system ATP-binding protein
MNMIEVNHVIKEYKLGQLRSALDAVRNVGARLGGKSIAKAPRFRAIDDVHFSVEPGEVLGLIGTNGAGKSTLLKILARVSRPTSGTVTVNGTVAPLIEVGAGLVPDLTGRENIYVNGTILGMSRAEIKRKFDEIVDFAELGNFIDTPIKRYSSGMQVRLGFSVATSVDTDVLIVDEVLAVGDLAFQRKCFDRIESLLKLQGKTVLLVSHNIRQVQRLCNRVILLDQGKISVDGPSSEVCDLYYERSDERIKKMAGTVTQSARGRYESTGEIELENIEILDESGHSTVKLPYRRPMTVSLRFKVSKVLEDMTFGVGVHTTDFLYLTTHNSEDQLHIRRVEPGICVVECQVDTLPLLPGVYSLRVGVTAGAAAGNVFYGENLLHFQVVSDPAHPIPVAIRNGFFALDATWQFHSESGHRAIVERAGQMASTTKALES